MPPELRKGHAATICQVLIDNDVEFVIIGGMAARLHGTGHATVDIDICPSADEANLSNLADALRQLGARLRAEGDPEGVAFEYAPPDHHNDHDHRPRARRSLLHTRRLSRRLHRLARALRPLSSARLTDQWLRSRTSSSPNVPRDDPKTSSPSHRSKHTYDAATDYHGHRTPRQR